MIRILLPLLIALAVAPAYASEAELLTAYAQWQLLRDPDSPGIVCVDGERFLRTHPGWPDEKSIRLRTEAAALIDPPDAATMGKFCADFPPISGRGMFACLRAKAGTSKDRDEWLHQGWIQGDFSADEEKNILNLFGTQLTRADHLKRIDRLLFEGKITPAKRMMEFVPLDHHALYVARMALIGNEKHAEAKLKQVTAVQRRNAGLLFDRIQWRIRKGMEDQLAELFMLAPATVPYPDLWWPSRAMATREALSKRDYGTALAILSGHGALKTEALADALWLKGWIILEYRKDAATAYKEFFQLYTNVGTPVSKARAAYWAARAAIKNGNRDIAKEWMEKAAKHPTVFYGQLAYSELHPDKPLELPKAPSFLPAQKDMFEREELVQLVRLLHRDGDTQMRNRFMTHLANEATEPARFALLANLARELGDMADAVRIAKQALRKGVVMIEAGWPRIALPANIGTEPALALAITRQESEFDPLACSSANAKGLMQLLPKTAQHVADVNGFSFSSLENPEQNITLGTAYLGQIIRGFDGSYLLGIASYNAGPANVRKWVASNGTPPKTLTGALNWIEAIPFAETRNYVMRVLENVQVYRTLDTPDAPLKLKEDLMR